MREWPPGLAKKSSSPWGIPRRSMESDAPPAVSMNTDSLIITSDSRSRSYSAGLCRGGRAEDLEERQIPPHIMAAMQERMRMAQRMAKVKHKVIVMSGKGGGGKSWGAANLAVVLAEDARVGLVDADVTGPDIPKLLGVEHLPMTAGEDGLEPVVGPRGVLVVSMAQVLADRDTAVVWRGPLKIKALKQMLMDVHWGGLGYLVVALPPGPSDEPLSIAQELPDADGAVVVTTPQEVRSEEHTSELQSQSKL